MPFYEAMHGDGGSCLPTLCLERCLEVASVVAGKSYNNKWEKMGRWWGNTDFKIVALVVTVLKQPSQVCIYQGMWSVFWDQSMEF